MKFNLKYLFYTLTIALTTVALAGCSSDEPDVPEPPEKGPAPRTVLVYMVADNSLGTAGFDTLDMNEMLEAAQNGVLGDSRLLVYHDGKNNAPELLELTPEGFITLKSYSASELSVSAARMQEAIDDAKAIAPARNYGLILWSHASGWLQNGMEYDSHISTNSFGSQSGKYMNVTTLADVVEDKGFDYIYFDCCYMAGVEVAYQLRNATATIAASSAELPAEGMPYNITLQYLLPEKANVIEACRSTFEYYDAKSGSERTCTLSVFDTSALNNLATATRNIMEQTEGLPFGFTPQRFMRSNCYIFDFGQYIEALGESVDPSLVAAWREQMENVVLYQQSTSMIFSVLRIYHHSGLTTYIMNNPESANTDNYYQLSWFTDVANVLFHS